MAAVGLFLSYWLAETTILILLLAAITLVIGYLIVERSLAKKNRKYARVFITGLAGVMVLFLAIAPFKTVSEETATFEDCAQGIEQRQNDESIEIDRIYCETQFANIWQPNAPTMLVENKEILVENFRHLIVNVVTPQNTTFSQNSLKDIEENNVGGKLNHIFQRWPEYQSRPFMAMGSVVEKYQLTNDDSGSNWVFQLGTTRNTTQSIYVRLLRPSDWEPQPAEQCGVALAKMIPIARGQVPSAVDSSTIDVIYTLGSKLECLPTLSQEEIDNLYEGLSPQQQELFKEGGSLD